MAKSVITSIIIPGFVQSPEFWKKQFSRPGKNLDKKV